MKLTCLALLVALAGLASVQAVPGRWASFPCARSAGRGVPPGAAHCRPCTGRRRLAHTSPSSLPLTRLRPTPSTPSLPAARRMMLAAAGPEGLADEALRALNGSLDGALLLRGAPGYGEAQELVESINSVYGPQRKPAVIVRAASVEDVQAAVRLAAEQKAPLCIKAGGHDSTGANLCDGGILIDVTPMKVRQSCLVDGSGTACGGCGGRACASRGRAGPLPAPARGRAPCCTPRAPCVRPPTRSPRAPSPQPPPTPLLTTPTNQPPLQEVAVDRGALEATLQAGARWKDVVAAYDAAGVDGVMGICPTVGAAGFTLGGGWGYWTKTKGVGVDNVLGFTVVLADGSVVTANATSEPDLFWALRGGGHGTLGVVTDITYKCAPGRAARPARPPAACPCIQGLAGGRAGLGRETRRRRWAAALCRARQAWGTGAHPATRPLLHHPRRVFPKVQGPEGFPAFNASWDVSKSTAQAAKVRPPAPRPRSHPVPPPRRRRAGPRRAVLLVRALLAWPRPTSPCPLCIAPALHPAGHARAAGAVPGQGARPDGRPRHVHRPHGEGGLVPAAGPAAAAAPPLLPPRCQLPARPASAQPATRPPLPCCHRGSPTTSTLSWTSTWCCTTPPPPAATA